jgi:hypothetical protein
MQDADKLAHDLIFLRASPVAILVRWKDQREISIGNGEDPTGWHMVVVNSLTSFKAPPAQITELQASQGPNRTLRIESYRHGLSANVSLEPRAATTWLHGRRSRRLQADVSRTPLLRSASALKESINRQSHSQRVTQHREIPRETPLGIKQLKLIPHFNYVPEILNSSIGGFPAMQLHPNHSTSSPTIYTAPI